MVAEGDSFHRQFPTGSKIFYVEERGKLVNRSADTTKSSSGGASHTSESSC